MKSKPILPPLLKCLIKFLLHKKVVSHSLASFLTMAKKFVLLYLKKKQRTHLHVSPSLQPAVLTSAGKNVLAWFKILGTLLMPTKLFGNIVSPPWLLQWSILRYKSCKEYKSFENQTLLYYLKLWIHFMTSKVQNWSFKVPIVYIYLYLHIFDSKLTTVL